jgi:hypothetical protein
MVSETVFSSSRCSLSAMCYISLLYGPDVQWNRTDDFWATSTPLRISHSSIISLLVAWIHGVPRVLDS